MNILTLSRDLIYPPRCPWCDRVLSPDHRQIYCCSSCIPRRNTAQEPVCFRCGKPLESEAGYCTECDGIQRNFVQNKGVYLYTGPTKDAIYRFKYSNRRCYARVFAKDAKERWEKWISRIRPDVITSVPMYLKKERERGYNQAAVFSKELGRQLNIPVREDLVIRQKATAPLKGLDPMQRKNMLTGAFIPGSAWRDPKLRKVLTGATILLTDDIYTTGTSLDLTSEALLRAGAGKIYTLTICVTE